jgi:hypothetical protein
MDGYALFDVLGRMLPRLGQVMVVIVAAGLALNMGWAGRVVDGYVDHVVRVAEQRVERHADRVIEQLRTTLPSPAVTPSPETRSGAERRAS